ncbi:MAG: squalene/phytoene synthase family protein [Pseudomonadota bacterium]
MTDSTQPQISDEIAFMARDTVRAGARDQYLSNLLLPQNLQPLAMVLDALHVELTNIALMRGEPVARQIRLQWWVEVFAGERRGEGEGHPLAAACLDLAESGHVSLEVLSAKANAHMRELYADPFEDKNTLEGWAGDTRATSFQLLANAARLTPPPDPALHGHAGVACGLIALLQTASLRLGNSSGLYPLDLLTAVGLTAEDVLEKAASPSGRIDLRPFTAVMVDMAQNHLASAQKHLGTDPVSRAIVRPLALVRRYGAAIAKTPDIIWQGPATLPQWRVQWLLWKGV